MKYRSILLVLTLALTLVACGDDDSNNDTANNTANNTSADAGTDTTSEDAGDEDVATIGDVSEQQGLEHRCDDAPIADWPLHEAVSSETVTASTSEGVTTFEIQASAGGSQAASENPFIYVNLETGEKVEVNDIEAYSSTDWDLAFKRYIIRANGADSGPADVSVAKLTDTTFADVTAAPSEASAYEQDVSYDESCNPLTDPIGTLMTAFNHLNPTRSSGSWYEYGGGVSPAEGEIYVIDIPGKSKTYKMEIEAWNDGVFTIHAAEL